MCAEFSEHFKSVWQPIPPERDAEFKATFDNSIMDIAYKTSAVPHITVEDVMKSSASLKLNKSPGNDVGYSRANSLWWHHCNYTLHYCSMLC